MVNAERLLKQKTVDDRVDSPSSKSTETALLCLLMPNLRHGVSWQARYAFLHLTIQQSSVNAQQICNIWVADYICSRLAKDRQSRSAQSGKHTCDMLSPTGGAMWRKSMSNTPSSSSSHAASSSTIDGGLCNAAAEPPTGSCNPDALQYYVIVGPWVAHIKARILRRKVFSGEAFCGSFSITV